MFPGDTACVAWGKSQAQFPAQYKLNMVAHVCNSITWNMETDGSEVQGHLHLHIVFEDRLENVEFHP